MDNWFCLNNIRLWIKGTIHEGELTLELSDKNNNYMDNLLEYPKENRNDIQDFEFLHRNFFLTSLSKVREWIKECSSSDEELNEILTTLDTKFPDIKNLRNMNEHDISYFKKEGHNQNQFIKEEANIYSIDATSVIINGDGYLIGGRLNVRMVIDYLNNLYPVIEKKLNRIEQ